MSEISCFFISSIHASVLFKIAAPDYQVQVRQILEKAFSDSFLCRKAP